MLHDCLLISNYHIRWKLIQIKRRRRGWKLVQPLRSYPTVPGFTSNHSLSSRRQQMALFHFMAQTECNAKLLQSSSTSYPLNVAWNYFKYIPFSVHIWNQKRNSVPQICLMPNGNILYHFTIHAVNYVWYVLSHEK